MTVSTTTNKRVAAGDNSTTDFAFTFPYFASSEIVVLVDGVTQTLTTDYTLSNSNPGGTVSFVSAPTSSEQVIIKRVIPQTQTFDYIENDNFPAASHEEALDRLVMIAQQMQEEIDRSLKVTETETGDFTFPSLDSNAGKTLIVNTSEDGFDLASVSGGGSLTTPLPIADGGTQSSSASAALIALGLATVSQAEAEAGTGTTTRAWTAQRVAQAVAALTSSQLTTGDAKITLKTTADSGWVLMDDGTIGDASSGASTRANADTEDLFELLWNNVSNTYAAVSGGRGASAQADFDAHKTITLTKQLGRAIAVAGTGSGLTARALGASLGEEDHQLTEAELAAHTHDEGTLATASGGSHTHTANFIAAGGGGNYGIDVGGNNDDSPGNISDTFTVNSGGSHTHTMSGDTGSAGSDTAHNNMQPTTFWNVMIKL